MIFRSLFTAPGIFGVAGALAAMLPAGMVSAATLIVPSDYATIQSAIDAASPGDMVIVEPGNYTENIELADGVDVVGRELARTILEPADTLAPTVNLRGVNDLRLSNLTLLNASVAVEVVSSRGIQLANIVFDSASDFAVRSDLNSVVDVINNVFFLNAAAISRASINVYVTNNIFRSNLVTMTSPLISINPNVNLEANCFSDNADLGLGGVDTGLGTAPVVGNPLFVDTEAFDFHLQEGSPCIDVGIGNDIIDNTVADVGAYGGEYADSRPFPLAEPMLTDISGTDTTDLSVEWDANQAYLVTNSVLPGSYQVYYKQGDEGPPYDGTDAGGGTQPSPIDVGDATTFDLTGLQPAAQPPGTPMLLSATGRNESVILTWGRVAGASAYRVHYGIDAVTENQVDTSDVTTFTVTGLVNGTTYRLAVSALNQATYRVSVTALDSTPNRNESVHSAEASIELGPVVQSPVSGELTATPEAITPVPELPDKGCFIATAAYGADWVSEVRLLRAFRDRYLMTNAAGRWFVEVYYALSPPVARFIAERDSLRAIVRLVLTPLVGLAWFLLSTSLPVKLGTGILAGGAAVLGIGRLRRRRLALCRSDS